MILLYDADCDFEKIAEFNFLLYQTTSATENLIDSLIFEFISHSFIKNRRIYQEICKKKFQIESEILKFLDYVDKHELIDEKMFFMELSNFLSSSQLYTKNTERNKKRICEMIFEHVRINFYYYLESYCYFKNFF